MQILSVFPCKPSHLIQCKLYQNESVIVPSTKTKKPCTAIFDLKTRIWRKLRSDIRETFINGTFERFVMKDGQEKLLYMGGKAKENQKMDDGIWEFHDNHWKKINVKLPKAIVENATKIFAPSPEFC